MGVSGAAGLEAQLRVLLRRLLTYEKQQQTADEIIQSLTASIGDRRYLEGDHLRTLLLDPQLQARCLASYNSRLLQQQARLECLHSDLEETVAEMQKATQACREAAAAAAGSAGTAAAAPVAAGSQPAAAAAAAAAAADPNEAAMMADIAGLMEPIAAAFARQVALQQRLLTMMHDIQCTDSQELQRLLLLFHVRPCEYPLRKAGCIDAAVAALRQLLRMQ
ncbi:hypothetical protein, conserved [Eimeria tenella]|uniref:Uncharacterized protein n=1 Tax=Eimeria tenella TaxID=5802 RepID=U6L1W1_EIMTE|nr:hypothetical protein, conserved [Eimeria tenella]CDJ42574.1 hypothetical protein, conserved [Eimeria tenella]|eukprot:XP_013233324.1 hypothetical protein, conserved [Eimeria tenella]